MDNPWSCDCHLKDFCQFVIQRNLSPSPITCYEPERLSDKTWTEVNSEDFACKPSVRILQKYLMVSEHLNTTIECRITGNPVPEVKWVLDGRIIANMSSSPHSRITYQKYVIREAGTTKGRNDCSGSQNLKIPGLKSLQIKLMSSCKADPKQSITGSKERISSLSIRNISDGDLGSYSCVAINQGGMAENNASLILHDKTLLSQMDQEAFIILVFTCVSVIFIIVWIILHICIFR